MGRFSYLARDSKGKSIQAVVDAETTGAVLIDLHQQGLTPISIAEVDTKLVFSKRERKKRWRISLIELSTFSRQLAVMLEAGLPIVDSLEDLAIQSENLNFQNLLEKVRMDVQKGDSFSYALAKHPKVFSRLYVSLVKAGEESGSLVQIMAELSSYLEDQVALRRKVRSATSYPLVVALFFCGAVTFVTLFLIPKFESIFSSFNVTLPLLTRVILKISTTILKGLPFFLGGIFLLVAFLFFYIRTEMGRYQLDYLKLRLPILGKIFHKIGLSYFSRALSILLSGGVSLITSLEIVSRASGNLLIERAVEKTRKGVIKGSTMAAELNKSPLFPRTLVRMVSVGEETGKTSEMLKRLADFYHAEVDATLSVLTAILEPILIIGLGVVVGITVIAIYLPIFKLTTALH